jgi:hypothetical protein
MTKNVLVLRCKYVDHFSASLSAFLAGSSLARFT